MRCSYYCCGDEFDLAKVSEYFISKGHSTTIHEPEVLMIKLKVPKDEEAHSIYIFGFGCITFWGFEQEKEFAILKKIKQFLKHPVKPYIKDSCTYSYSGKSTQISEETDTIHLSNNDPYIKLSLSYGLSQSVKLQQFENSVDRAIKENEHIPQEIIKKGKIQYSRKTLAIKIGSLLAERHLINLHSSLLDTPEFFWRRPKYESYYDLAVDFMDIEFRLNILNNRLEVLNDLYNVLSTELQHIHSSRLEIIIILLILVEVIISLLRDIFEYI
jgi:uncharacterized Rmd1/YagE family protein